jgi:hypothetical protein
LRGKANETLVLKMSWKPTLKQFKKATFFNKRKKQIYNGRAGEPIKILQSHNSRVFTKKAVLFA